MKNTTSILLLFLTFLFVNVGNADAQQDVYGYIIDDDDDILDDDDDILSAHAEGKREYVDLGLPSGTLWATINIGASDPDDEGVCFAWGEIEPKDIYERGTYKYYRGGWYTKYLCAHGCGYNHFLDCKWVLDPSDDAATANWGSDWCMPDLWQWEELLNKCVWTWTTSSFKHGFKVKGPNGNSIFLPSTRSFEGIYYGEYWSSTVSSWMDDNSACNASTLFFDSESYDINFTSTSRYLDNPVRPVRRRNIETSQSPSIKHKAVDLGLPSRTLWATTNVGATTPEGYGDYFAWGEIEAKDTYYHNYKYSRESDSKNFTKYCSKSDYGYNGYTDNRTILEKADDVAYQKWGSEWCMPTLAQFLELKEKCIWTSATCNGKRGYEIKGPNGNTIFLPAAGFKNGSGQIWEEGSCGYYWSSSLCSAHPNSAEDCNFVLYSNIVRNFSTTRTDGYSVRPVRCSN